MTRRGVRAVAIATLWIAGTAALPATAAEPELVALVNNGPAERCIDLVIVAEGYLASQRQAFLQDAATLSEGVLSYGPYAAVRGLVNVHGLFVASSEAGADHPSTAKYAKTAFDATYETGGIKRLLTADEGKVLVAVNAALPDWDLAVVLVNDAEYGGSGGAVPAVSTSEHAISILRHELGHNVGGLADEYEAEYPGKEVTDSEPNVALLKHLQPLKWQHWVTTGTPIPTPIDAQTDAFSPIGAYEGARYQSKGMFRPAPTCIMRELTSDFCPVCFESLTVGMAKRVQAVVQGYPATKTVQCGGHGCPSLEVVVAGVQQLRVRWLVDGALKTVTNGLWWTPTGLDVGEHAVVADVRHASAKIRQPVDGVAIGKWQWVVQVSAVAAIDPASKATRTTAPPVDNGCGANQRALTGAPGWLLVLIAGMVAIARRRACESR
jgi:hypothetical protein